MNTQPEALRLAGLLDFAVQTYYEPGGYLREEDQLMAYAAAELRRLHEVNQMLVATLHTAENQIRVLAPDGYIAPALDEIHSALAKAKEQA